MDAYSRRHCISCGAPLGQGDVLCPACGALNTRDIGSTGRPYRKRFRFLWWTYTVRGTDLDFVEMESAFGVRISYSLGRWVLIHVLGIVFVTAMVLVSLAAWSATARLFFLGFAMFIALLDVALIAFFGWSMIPPKGTR